MIHSKTFETYDDYIQCQGMKLPYVLEKMKSSNMHQRRLVGFTKMFVKAKEHMIGGRVLCLGARTGEEVEAARKAGFLYSIGVDLYPVGNCVVKADWHDLPFDDNSFENVFTNSLDHCFDLPKLVMEVKRVLIPGGVFFLVASEKFAWATIPIQDRMKKSKNEALFWDNADELMMEFKRAGLKLFESWVRPEKKYYFMRNSKDGN